MELAFEKMHGLGNDFAVFEDWEGAIELSAGTVRWLCDRHFGIGADGLIFVRPADDPSCRAFMHYINADGSLAQMCGNGVRCFAKYLVDHGYVDEGADELGIQTRAGAKRVRFQLDGAGKMARATVDMGEPILEPARIPALCFANAAAPDGAPFVGDAPITTPWGEFRLTLVSMGNPHAVCFIDDWERLPDALFADAAQKGLETFDVAAAGSFLERHEIFPEKANIEFVQARGERLDVRVWERGCGETLACGTGACATAVAAALTGRAARKADVALPGGTLSIEWRDDGHVLMTGPAETVYTGTIRI